MRIDKNRKEIYFSFRVLSLLSKKTNGRQSARTLVYRKPGQRGQVSSRS